MKVVQIRGKDVLEFNQNAPEPIIGNEQVLVGVHAASINPVNWKTRTGYVKEMVPLTMPATLSGDIARSTCKVCDRVYGYASLLSWGSGQTFVETPNGRMRMMCAKPDYARRVFCQ